ncbi:Elongin-A-like [Homarus americanus]|uniref:Elongin-A-like n=1 Tax=Homarus americanus TaxID=6706 RepID=A0A8J5JK48_HOMAM|nr:Elongin-A-like [Homarus americanus]
MSNVAEQIHLYQRKLEKYAKGKETDKLLYYIHKLKYLDVTVSHLEVTGVGRSVNSLRHHEGLVGEKARALVNKWKVMVKAEEDEGEDEEFEEEETEEEEEEEKERAKPVAPQRNKERHEAEDRDSEGGEEDDEEDDRLQIEEDANETVEYEDEGDGYKYIPEPLMGSKIGSGYGDHSLDSDDENMDSYNPVTSQRDYQMNSGSPAIAVEYHPSGSRMDSPAAISSPSWKDGSPSGSFDRKNGSSSKSSPKKSIKEDKERYREKERHKDREKNKHKESSGSHKEHKHKEKHKHRDREERKAEKEKIKSHKDKHRDKDRHNSDKTPDNKHNQEEYSEKSRSEKDLEGGIVNGFSTPEVERSVEGRQESRDSDKRDDEKRKDKSHRKENSSGRDSLLKENRIKESSRERESSRENENKVREKEKRKEEKHRDKNKDSSACGSSKKDKHKKDLDPRKNQRELEDSESDKKKKKKSDGDEGAAFGAALMGLDSPVKRKKKKKKKSLEKERDSSDDEQPSTSHSSNKRIHSDGGGLPDPKKPRLLIQSPQKIPTLPSLGPLIPDEAPLLPEINPNYKPLPRVPIRDEPSDCITSKMTEEEALNIMLQSKSNRRSKVYSGKVSGLSYVPTLYEVCIRVLQENIDALEFTGGIPFEILRPVLERASPQQLLNLEDYNHYLLQDTNKLEEMETWREMWIRCFEERERKLKSLTQNLQQRISTAVPKRTTKLAFVDTAAKVPKSVARAQAKYGTAAPSATAAKPGKANEVAARKTAMQNVQRAERVAGNPRPVSAKNKKVAPLMAKTRQFFKKAFRR